MVKILAPGRRSVDAAVTVVVAVITGATAGLAGSAWLLRRRDA